MLVKTTQALGYVGPIDSDKLIINMLDQGKLTPGDMTPYCRGHSYMKAPTDDVMKHGFQTFIINSNDWAVDGFGNYIKAEFPNVPLPDDLVEHETDKTKRHKTEEPA